MPRPTAWSSTTGPCCGSTEDRFLVYTTTGSAAAVLDWMEDWLQTEWPHLRVHCTSVTEQWATFPVVGPRSRDVVAAVTGLDTSNEAFPFMTWQDTRIGDVRVPARARVSFSGELAFEVNVDAWHALAVWERLIEAGGPYGITPYGTETMHVLRAEKGYPIIGQDTDGTVTPQDLGMAWAVSKKKPDFLGKRSFARAGQPPAPTASTWSACCRWTHRPCCPEGSQIVEGPTLPDPPVPMLGHVTSSYRSAELGRTFALALVKGGRYRIGERRLRPVAGDPRPGRGRRPVLSTPKEPVVMAEPLLAQPRPLAGGGTASLPCPTGAQITPSRSSRWSTSGSTGGAGGRGRAAYLGVDLPTTPSTDVEQASRPRLARSRTSG